MTDIERAKALFELGGYTCVLVKNGKVRTSTKTGVAPMVGFLNEQLDMKDAAVADKIVGKAAAMLFLLAGVSDVYAAVLSTDALELFIRNGVGCSYGVLTDAILNREGTDCCPMDKAVREISDPQKALTAIQSTLRALSQGGTGAQA